MLASGLNRSACLDFMQSHKLEYIAITHFLSCCDSQLSCLLYPLYP